MDSVSNENPQGAGSDDGVGKSPRVGTAERDKAVALLGEHWRAGRLDPGEHELRVTRARAAVTQADLDVLFADLPAGDPAQQTTAAVDSQDPGGSLEGRRDTIMALTPFAALVLFFLTGSWLWFLMIPVLGILFYGAGGSKRQRRHGR
jgi:hypothetical protein